MTDPLDKLSALGLVLPVPKPPVANYVPVTRAGPILYIAGQVSANAQGVITGRLGETMDVAAGRRAAQCAGLFVLAQIVHGAGVPLDRVKRLLKVTGYVASAPDFLEHPQVINGASDLFVAVLGERGQHARAAVGVAALPMGAAVEVDAIVELFD